jgi:glycosyltransferase involved in cell wall biosynthesis
MDNQKKVSIIVCVYNEETTIQSVIEACANYNKDSEIIVVDDGSTDSTESILRKMAETVDFRYIRQDTNRGKSYAMALGVEEANNEIILFFDADVTGIKKEHFEKILQPMYTDEADMVLGHPSETLIDYRVNPFKGLTGERAMFRKDILAIIDEIREISFGIETYINLYYKAHGKRIKYIIMDGLTHPTKYKKTSAVKATVDLISEGQEIAQTLLKNYDLITKRIEYSFNAQNEILKNRLITMQKELNDKIRSYLSSGEKDKEV